MTRNQINTKSNVSEQEHGRDQLIDLSDTIMPVPWCNIPSCCNKI
jgi:hypothetical protein